MILARTYSDVKQGLKQNKLVALIGVEGGHMIEDDLDRLRMLYDMGMRYLTLTWNNSTSWATSAMDESKGSFSFSDRDMKSQEITHKGLNDFGKQVIQRMNQLGIIVDLSHTGEQTFYDAIATTKKPVLLSHSSVWALCPVFRNVKDEQIKAVAKNKGVICINFYSGFISRKWDEKQNYLRGNKKDIINYKWAGLDSSEQNKLWKQYYDSTLDANRPTISELVDHIDYIRNLVGVRYVGIGSDFDGVSSLPVGMDDVTKYPLITAELKRRGYSDWAVKKVLGQNVLRVMRKNMR
jgi:membrane dipeptidase